jgi:transcriptional regulator GlxA family with amidase domain
MAEMSKTCEILPMGHKVSIFVFPNFELLDASGPASAFEAANHALADRGKQPFYAIELISPAGGLVQSSCGIAVETRALSQVRPANTFLVESRPGPPASRKAHEDRRLELGVSERHQRGGLVGKPDHTGDRSTTLA